MKDASDTIISVNFAPPTGDGEIRFSAFDRPLAAGSSMDYFVMADIAATAPVGATVAINLEDEAGATAGFSSIETGVQLYPLGPPFFGSAVKILLDNTPPDFDGLNPIAPNGAHAHLTWPMANDEAGTTVTYHIWQSTSSSFLPSGPADYTTTKLEHYIGNLDLGTTYYFIARAYDLVGNNDGNTVRRDFTPTDPDPPIFAGLESATPRYDGLGTIRLRWQPAADISLPITYNIYYSTDPDFIPGGVPNLATLGRSTPLGLEFDVPGLPIGMTQTFIVRAEDFLGQEDANLIRRLATPTDTIALGDALPE